MDTVLQVCVALVLFSLQAVIASAEDCPDADPGGTSCTISLEKLLDRAVQHAELIYRVSEESKLLFDKWILHTVLILIQFWTDPLADLQASLENYENNLKCPAYQEQMDLYQTNGSLKQGVLVLVRQILGEGGLLLEAPEETSNQIVSSDIESVRRGFSVLYCML